MELKLAQKIASKYLELLRPFCLPGRCVVAGSVLREKPEPKDIEIVCIPTDDKIISFIEVMESLQKVKGEATGKYTQRILPEGINLDLFMVTPENWGYILAIRTGPAGYSKYLVDTWKRCGYKGIDGMLTKNGVPIPVREEKDLFDLLGLEWVDPQYRMDIQDKFILT